MRETLQRSGRLGQDLLAVDWEATPVGPPERWPTLLRTTVRTMLGSRFPMWVGWGPDLTFFCNDAYRQVTLGRKYPWALGRPAPEVWPEAWGDVAGLVERVFREGASIWEDRLMLVLERSGYPEETYHTFSYSPVAEEDGRVAGLLCVVSEDTDEVIANRRIRALGDLGGRLGAQLGEDDVVAATAAALAECRRDVPFHLVYLYDERGAARLAWAGDLPPGHPAAPASIEPGDEEQTWPVPGPGEAITLTGLDPARLPDLPAGGWDVPPTRAAVVPIRGPQGVTHGFVVFALNPFRQLDDDYGDFLKLVGGQLGAAITDSRAFEAEHTRANNELARTRRTRLELERSQELLGEAERLARMGSWSVELGSGRIRVSAELLRIIGRTQAEVERLGHPGFLVELVDAGDRPFVRAVVGEARLGDEIAFEARMRRADGSQFFASVRGVVKDTDDLGPVLRCSLQDVTERRRAAESVRVAHAATEVAARERQIADELQASLLPESNYNLKHLEVATYYRAGAEGSQVGGDWYDVIELDGGRTGLVIGDVMGHGVRSAAVMGQLRTAVRAYARLGLPPVPLMESLDALVWDLFPEEIVTCVYAVFDPDTLAVDFLNAGHVPPLLLGEDGTATRLETEPHPPLGVGHKFPRAHEVRLTPGAGVLLYTDGLVERRGHDLEHGIAALTSLASRLEEPLAAVPEALVRALLPEAPDDDVALLVARTPRQVSLG